VEEAVEEAVPDATPDVVAATVKLGEVEL